MRLKKTAALALAAVMLTTSAALPAFAADSYDGIKKVVTIYTDNNANAGTTVNGASVTPADTATTEVKYFVTETYTWTIPSEIDFGKDKDVGKTITVSSDETDETNNKYKNEHSKVVVKDNVIPEGKKLQIKVSGANYGDSSYRLKNGNNTYLKYTITKGTETQTLTDDAIVMTVNAGTDGATEKLKFELSTANGSNTSEISGKYTDTLTFTATVEDQTA